MSSNKPGVFQKNDARINRKGRPRNFDGLRELGLSISSEPITKDGEPVTVNGHVLTVTEAILRQWAQSRDARLQMAFIEVTFGKVPNVTQLTGANGTPIQTEHTVNHDLTRLTPEELTELRTIVAKATSVDDSVAE